ncbi:MAG: hypothetical protein AAF939_11940 [Planctomycetota bacterium]
MKRLCGIMCLFFGLTLCLEFNVARGDLTIDILGTSGSSELTISLNGTVDISPTSGSAGGRGSWTFDVQGDFFNAFFSADQTISNLVVTNDTSGAASSFVGQSISTERQINCGYSDCLLE